MWPWRPMYYEVSTGSTSSLPNRRATLYQITRQQAWSLILISGSCLLHHHPPSFFLSFFILFSSILSTILYATQCTNASTLFDIDIMNDSTSSEILGVRKRVDSTADDQIVSNLRKRPRVSSMAGPFSLNDPISIGVGIDRLPRPMLLQSDEADVSSSSLYFPSQPGRPLSGSSSFTTGSRAGSPLLIGELASATTGSAHISRSGMALMRRVSSASIRSSSPAVQVYPENSAKHFLRNTKVTIDYSPPNASSEVSARLLSCSFRNTVFFARGNRVHYKNMTTSEEVGQLCKLQDSCGDLRGIECGGLDQPDIVALSTTKGIVQIWDVQAKKITMNWTTTKGISAMRWNGPVLTIGGLKGTIRHYDTRINPIPKMKEQARKVTRHQAPITSLDWNVDGKYLASGDAAGTVYCWEPGQKVPLDVGEFIQRRKKIQHVGAISSVVWCPWQPRLLATGDTKGILRLWNINPNTPHCNAATPGKLETGAVITGLHFSPQCKEILTTHGASISDSASNDSLTWPRTTVANSLAVYSYPSFRHVTTLPIADSAIGDSVLNAHGTKIIFAMPKDGKLNVCDVWTKRKEIKKQPSFMGNATIR